MFYKKSPPVNIGPVVQFYEKASLSATQKERMFILQGRVDS